MPKVPTLFTALTTSKDATNPKVYGETVNPYVLQRGEIVQIVLNNLDDGGHPFHLHVCFQWDSGRFDAY
jgi:iron transport multicopper oxidase